VAVAAGKAAVDDEFTVATLRFTQGVALSRDPANLEYV